MARVVNAASAADRVKASLQGDFEFACDYATERYSDLVESEIELVVLGSLLIFGRLMRMNIYIGEEDPVGPHDVRLIPQYQWQNYRIDFCIRGITGDQIFVECDGHEFHERTKEQAERDRSKDRAIQAAGIPILRFTGREIWRDGSQIAVEILKFMSSDRAQNNG